MKRLLFAIHCIVALTRFGPSAGAEKYLVKDGEPRAEIIIAVDAAPVVRTAARFLQTDIAKMTGATLPIRNEPGGPALVRILVGRSAITDARGLDVGGLAHGGYRLKSGDGWLALLGRDRTFLSQRHAEAGELFKLLRGHPRSAERRQFWRLWYEKTGEAWGMPYATFWKTWNEELQMSELDERGTFNAVAGFLRRLGVRHYMPGPLGEVIPQRSSIVLPEIDETVRPDFPIRWANQHGQGFRNKNMDEKLWQLWMGFNRAADLQDATFAFHGTAALTETRTDRGLFSHPRADEPKPAEIFAVYGGRNSGSKQCLSSEALFEANVKYVRAVYDIFDAPMVSVMPSDSFTSLCQCEKCAGRDSPERPFRARLSDYVWSYVDRVAREVYKTHPDRKVVGMSYNTYRYAPTNLGRFSPNVVVSIVQGRSGFQQNPEARAEIEEIRRSFLPLLGGDEARLMQDDHYRITPAVPGFYPHAIAEDLKSLKDISLGDFIDIERGDWRRLDPMMSIQHLNIYVTGRCWWDADQDIDVLLDEFYRNFYGPAQREMKTLVEYAEANWMGLTHDAKKIARVLALFADARAKVPVESLYAQRLDLIAEWMAPLEYRGDQLAVERVNVPEHRVALNDGKKLLLDGKMDEAFWNVSGRYHGILRETQTGARAAFPTRFSVAWTDNSICFGIRCQDLPGQPALSTSAKLDDPAIWQGDCVEILLETQVHGYYQIAISPDGAIVDLSREGRERNRKWKSHAQAATHIGDDYWSVEVRIPVAGTDRKEVDPNDGVAGTMPTDAYPWYFNVCRQRKRDHGQLNLAFSPTGHAGFHNRARFAWLATGMRKSPRPETASDPEPDHLQERERALTLKAGNKTAKALKLFTELARRQSLTDAQRVDAQEQSVDCLLRLKRFDEARKLAARITFEPVAILCQMRIMRARRQGRELVERFHDHDFATWPDRYRGEAHHLRGTAAYFGKVDPRLARNDLKQALRYSVTLPGAKVAARKIASYLEKL